MIFSVLMIGGTFFLFIYLLFIRTEILRKKLIKSLPSFELIEDNSISSTHSKYVSTNDPRPRVVLVKGNVEVFLLTCSTHGQLKNIYLLCLAICDADNSPGIYGKGRGRDVLKSNGVQVDFHSKGLYRFKDSNEELVRLAQFIEVNDGKAFMFFTLSSYWGGSSIIDLVATIENH